MLQALRSRKPHFVTRRHAISSLHKQQWPPTAGKQQSITYVNQVASISGCLNTLQLNANISCRSLACFYQSGPLAFSSGGSALHALLDRPGTLKQCHPVIKHSVYFLQLAARRMASCGSDDVPGSRREKNSGRSAGSEIDAQHMLAACKLAHECEPVKTAYNVGAVLLDAEGEVIGTGFSRELPGNTHAEQCALAKAAEKGHDAAGGTMFSSMEPCSTRLSGNESCTSRLISAKVARVVLAAMEPATFVQCKGVELLQASGIQVDIYTDDEVLQLVQSANAHIGAHS